MWLLLTTVTFVGPKNKTKTIVRKSRINMDNIETYFEAADEIKNMSAENKCNTLMLSAKDGNSSTAYHVVETVEEIDEMIGLDRLFDEKPKGVDYTKATNEGGWGTKEW